GSPTASVPLQREQFPSPRPTGGTTRGVTKHGKDRKDWTRCQPGGDETLLTGRCQEGGRTFLGMTTHSLAVPRGFQLSAASEFLRGFIPGAGMAPALVDPLILAFRLDGGGW